MTQLIMLFFFPIGLYFYFFIERKDRPEYQKIFDDFQIEIQNDTTMTDEEKRDIYRDMLVQNRYKITQFNKKLVKGERRIFSMSLFIMSFGILYIGAILYLIYYFWIQKPHVVEYKI